MDATLGLLQLALARETMSRICVLACLARAQLANWAVSNGWRVIMGHHATDSDRVARPIEFSQ